MTNRIACRAVFLDAGGVIVLPDRHLLTGALAQVGIDIDPSTVPQAHYRAVRALDQAVRALGRAPGRSDYPGALFAQIGIAPGRTAEAIAVWERLADRARSSQVLWSEPTPGAHGTIASFQRAGLVVVIVTNSDGHGAENLAASGFAGVPVIDSHVIGAAKPDPRIFEIALARAGAELVALGRPRATVTPVEVVHIGDMLSTDVAGARAAGITPIHFDPLRACRATDHRHVRSLSGVWRHVAAA
jgi:putative hydrolase of the HAD superfamily